MKSSFLVQSQSSNEVRQFFGSISYRLLLFYLDSEDNECLEVKI